jgi:hypothetical protein
MSPSNRLLAENIVKMGVWGMMILGTWNSRDRRLQDRSMKQPRPAIGKLEKGRFVSGGKLVPDHE